MQVDYEEKTFESALNHELLGMSSWIFTPGQVLESILGVDAGLFVGHPVFWRRWRRGRPLGVLLDEVAWHRSDKPHPPFPSFRLNLFLQHKRPEFLSATHAKEWHLWKEPYFRFDITSHQQAVLEAAATAVGSNALVAYSCPALETASRLYAAIEDRVLVDNTNFVEAPVLNGHDRYTFATGGTDGWACSDPERVQALPLLEVLPERIAAATEQPLLSAAERAALAMLRAHPSLADKAQHIQERIAEAADEFPTNVRERLRKFLFVIETSRFLGVSWLVGASA